ncbi:MAG: guanylate kinase [Oscillospiraceae bacterium]|nr:guanylate kinase [Oscillospiraceae bacterium]
MNKGKLFVISGPSGSGKSTVICRLLKELDKAYFSISATTREPREGERDGVDYHFMKKEEFEKLVEADQLLEYAQFVGNYYGTPAAPVDEKLNAGYDVILDIETQGAEQILSKRPDAVSVFIFPPSFAVLEQRLRMRGTDSEDKIIGRLAQARVECKKAEMYNYIIINDRIETACNEVMAIITAEKCRTAERLHHLKEEN